MKRVVLFLTIAAAGFAALCLVQRQRLASQEAQMAALLAEMEAKKGQIAELERARERAAQQNRQLLQTADELYSQVRAQAIPQAQVAAAPPELPLTNAEPANRDAAGFGGMLSKMMSDPDTRKLIRDQQRMMMDQLYRPLVKQLGLSAEEAGAFKDLLADNMTRGAEKAASLIGNLSGTNRAELAGSLAAEQRQTEEQLKAFLGEDRFAIYKDYQETVGERAQINQFRQQNDAGEYPLNDLQVEQLLGLMKDEKRNAAAAVGLGAANDAIFSEEQSQKFMQAQELANQRVFERARSVLSPDQLRGFGVFQTNQLQMMRMGLSLARKMMASGAPESQQGQ